MGRRRWMVAGGLGAAAIATVGSAIALAVSAAPSGHLPLHIGCTNHNHGPKWHAGHGRSALGNVPGGEADGAPSDVRRRGIAAQR